MPRPINVRPSACASFRDDIIAAQELDLIARDRKISGKNPSEAAIANSVAAPIIQASGKRQRQKKPLAFGHLQNKTHDLFEARDFRAAELIDFAALRLAVERDPDRFRNIADIDGLQLRLAAADQRQSGQQPRHGGETVEELIFGTENDGGPQNDSAGQRLQHRGFAGGFGARIKRRRIGIGAERRHMDEILDAGGLGGFGQGARAALVDRLECLRAARAQNADEIDDGIRVLDRRRNQTPESADWPAPA